MFGWFVWGRSTYLYRLKKSNARADRYRERRFLRALPRRLSQAGYQAGYNDRPGFRRLCKTRHQIIMSFKNPTDSDIRSLLTDARTIAVVGLSARSHRPSHGVSRALQRFGYRVIPVNPGIDEVLGERSYPTLAAAVEAGLKIDIVDVFRSPGHVEGIVSDCIELKLPALWLQEGVIAEPQAARAADAGIFTVMDRCIYKEYVRLVGAGK